MTEPPTRVETSIGAESPLIAEPDDASFGFGGPIMTGFCQIAFGILLMAVAVAMANSRANRRVWESRQSIPSVSGLRIDMNQASEKEITLAPGVGPVLARRIIMSRNQDGPFESMHDLRRVHGIGSRTLDRIATIGFVREVPGWRRGQGPHGESGTSSLPSTGPVKERLANR